MAGNFNELVEKFLCGPTARGKVQRAKSDPVYRKTFVLEQADEWAATAHGFGGCGQFEAQARAQAISDAWSALARRLAEATMIVVQLRSGRWTYYPEGWTGRPGAYRGENGTFPTWEEANRAAQKEASYRRSAADSVGRDYSRSGRLK